MYSNTKQLVNSEATLQFSLPEMALVEDSLQSIFAKSKGIIREAGCGLLSSGGKRIRPLLTIAGSLCCGPFKPETIHTAVAAELIHMASLVHDDVIDSSSLRRGINTVNSTHGNCTAVLVGDYIFAEAFKVLSSHRLLAGMGYLVEAIQQMCDGEVNQAEERFLTNLNTEKYFCRIAKKTGILLAACCKAGAASAGAGEREIDSLGRYGLNLGYAYQIIDDILDFTATSDKLGKPSGEDVSKGNVTLPVIILMQNPVYGNWLKQVLDTRLISSDGVESIKQAMYNDGSIEKAYAVAENCIVQAKQSLHQLPNNDYNLMLTAVADQVLRREA